jgi:hypothetical protein
MRAAILCLIATACAGAQQSPEACLAPKLALVDAQYFAEAVERCQGFTWAECPYRDEIAEKYNARRGDAERSCQ